MEENQVTTIKLADEQIIAVSNVLRSSNFNGRDIEKAQELINIFEVPAKKILEKLKQNAIQK